MGKGQSKTKRDLDTETSSKDEQVVSNGAVKCLSDSNGNNGLDQIKESLHHDFVIIHANNIIQKKAPAHSNGIDRIVNVPKATQDESLTEENRLADASPSNEIVGRVSNTMLTEVTFEWENVGSCVFVSGNFDNWTSRVPLAARTGSSYKVQLQLPPGNSQIKFIVDGEWYHNPRIPVVDDSFGGYNNVITV